MGREALIDALACYKRLKRHRITVVFDGGNASWPSSRSEQHQGIEIQYSRQGQTADEVITKFAARLREKALVVSSDREVIEAATRSCAATIDSNSFEHKITAAAQVAGVEDFVESFDADGWKPTTKKKGPRRRLSKRARRNRSKIAKL